MVCLSAAVMLPGRGDLHARHSKQSGTEYGQNYLSHCKSPLLKRREQDSASHASALAFYIAIGCVDYYAPANHEAASNSFDQKEFWAKFSAGKQARPRRLQRYA
jgi:hypothetical protein